ncbi:TonB family protein [Sphingomonas sp. UYAg733]
MSEASDPRPGTTAGAKRWITVTVLTICGLLIVASIGFILLSARDRPGNTRPKIVQKTGQTPSAAVPVTPTDQPVGPGARPVPRVPDPPYSKPAILAVPKGNMGDWFPQDSYPAEARRVEEEGRVTVSVAVDPKGVPQRCWIVSSSGSESLDDATCRLALENGEFFPARDAGGRSMWTVFSLRPVKWQIEDR